VELITARIGERNVRVALFIGDECAAATYQLADLKHEDAQGAQFEVARWLVSRVRPNAGPHVVYQVAEKIANAIKEYE
jgi:hypothetical protein